MASDSHLYLADIALIDSWSSMQQTTLLQEEASKVSPDKCKMITNSAWNNRQDHWIIVTHLTIVVPQVQRANFDIVRNVNSETVGLGVH